MEIASLFFLLIRVTIWFLTNFEHKFIRKHHGVLQNM